MLYAYKNYIKNRLYNNSLLWKFIEFGQGLVFTWKYYYHYVFAFQANSTTSITEINIEFSSACNLRCGFCSLDHTKPQTYIEPSTLEKFLDELISEKRFQSVQRLQLFNAGETLLHPKKMVLLKMIKEYKEKALTQGKRFPEVHILSNAMLLKERVSKEILDLDLIDVMRVSLDGGTPSKFEEMRNRAKWPIFFRNIKAFNAYRKAINSKAKLWTTSIIPADKTFDLNWMHTEFREILEESDEYELRRLHNWAGEIDGLEVKNKKYKIGCTLVMNQMVLLPNGDVTVCCSDLNSRGVVGNILNKSFHDIYSSKERRRYVDLLMKGKKEQLELCAECETF